MELRALLLPQPQEEDVVAQRQQELSKRMFLAAVGRAIAAEGP